MVKQPRLNLSKDDIFALRALTPGTTVDLQISTPTAPQRVKTSYVGMDLPNCMIFHVPQNAKWTALRDLLMPENDIVVRYVIEGDAGAVIAFRVQVQRLINSPCTLLITTAPDKLQSLGLRAEKRSQPGIAVSLQLPRTIEDSTLIEHKGLIVDVSATGCRIAIILSPELGIPAVGSEVTFAVNLNNKTCSLDGILRNVRRDSEQIFLGIQFESDEKAVAELLEQHVLLA